MSAHVPELRVIDGGASGERSEGDLLRAFFEGDGAAFGVLVRRHQDTVYRVVRRFAKSREDARDLTQRAFLQALEHAERTQARFDVSEGPTPFKAWLLRIAVNLAKNHSRDAGRWAWAQVDAVDFERPQAPAAHEVLERKEAEDLTRRAVLALPPRQREVFSLRIDGGLPFAEIARVLDITEGNAKAHFHYAVKRLKEEVAKLGGAS